MSGLGLFVCPQQRFLHPHHRIALGLKRLGDPLGMHGQGAYDRVDADSLTLCGITSRLVVVHRKPPLYLDAGAKLGRLLAV